MRAPLAVEALEDRTVMAVLPQVTVPGQTVLPFLANPPITSNNNTPSIVVDPTNSQRLVAVYSAWVTAGTTGVPFSVVIVSTSTDGGNTWSGALAPGNLTDPASTTTPPAAYANQVEPSVAIDRSGAFYVTLVEHNGLTLANRTTGGALVMHKYDFNADPTTPLFSRTLYQWVTDDPVLNPVVVVDTTLGPTVDDPNHPGEKVSFVDPETGATQANLLGNPGGSATDRVFIAWNTNNTAPPNANNFNPNVIKMIASVDGGSTFSTQMYVSDGANSGTARHSFPTLAVAQGSSSDRLGSAPGPLQGVANLTRVGPNILANAPGHGFQNGDEVRITGSRLPLALTVASLTQTDGTATLTTDTPHGLTTGTHVVISGANQAGYNGLFEITVTSPTTFAYSVPVGTPASATGTITLETTYDGRFIVSVISGSQFAYSLEGNATGTATGAITVQALNNAVQGGTIALGWNNFGAPVNNRSRILADTITDGGVGVVVPGNIGAVTDGFNPGSDPHQSRTTDFTANVTAADFANGFRTIADLDVNVTLVHPHLNQVTLQLIAPDGTTFTLINPSSNASGQAITPAQGLPDNGGSNTNLLGLGVLNNGRLVGTTFDSDAPRSIRNGTAPYAAHFRPEDLFGLGDYDGLLPSTQNAAGEAFIIGTWTLRVIDNRNDGTTAPIQRVAGWSLNFTSGLTNGADTLITSDPFGRPDAPPGAATGPFPTTSLANPDRGIGAMPQIAFDNTLGSFSPFQGRAYLTYTQVPLQNNAIVINNTNIMLATSDDGGASWGVRAQVNDDGNALDDFSEGNRAQFSPSVAVDQSTGTLVLSWYDARHDAANARVTTYLGISIDGGNTFAPQTFVNRTSTAQDALTFDPATGTNTVVNLEPIPDNLSAGNANREANFGYGYHQGLAVANGRIFPVWASNENNSGALGATQNINNNNLVIRTVPGGVPYGSGPRIIASTMGSVATPNNQSLQTTVITDLTDPQNGTRLADRFALLFDRPIDPGTLTPADVAVLFRSPTMQASDPGVSLRVVSILPLLRTRLLTDDGFGTGTLVTALPHDLVSGDLVTITGANESLFNGTFVVSVLDANTVLFALPVTLQPVTATGSINLATFYGATGVQRTQYYEVRFDPNMQSNGVPYTGTHTGTYSYAVGPDIFDRVRLVNPVVIIGSPIGTFTSADTPLAIPDVTTVQSHILINNPAFVGQQVSDVNVRVRLNHTFDSDLQITLIAPSGQRIVLSQNRGGSGDNFGTGTPPAHNPTIFDDQAATPISAGGAPFVGSFRPDQPLALANGESVNGDWILEVDDQVGQDVGTLFTWSLDLFAGTAVTVLNSGNQMDQDADSFRGEANQDVYAAPRSLNGVPFALPYDPNTLPIIVPGPHVVSTIVPLTVPVLSLFQVPHNPADGLGTATVTTATPHGLSNGDQVRISGANEAGYNGTFAITVTGPTTFTYTVPAATATQATGSIEMRRITGPSDNLVLNSTNNSLDVVFDRDMDPASFEADGRDVLEIVGPTGSIPLTAAVTALTQAGGTATLTTATPHGLSNGDRVAVGGAADLPLALVVQSLSHVGGTATLTTSTGHGLTTGDSITISGANQAGYNGVFTITVTGPNSFTYTVPVGTPSPASGSITLVKNTAVGNYNGVFTVTVTGPNSFTYSVPAATPATATGALTLRLTTVSPDPDATTDPDPNHPRTFRVTFPRQFLPGSYAIKLGANIRAKNGELLDTNQNAGLAVLRGTDPTTNFVPLNLGVTSLSHVGGTATLVMNGPHGIATGAQVLISGANQAGYNGVFTVTVTSPTTMQFSVPTGTPATASGAIQVSATPLTTVTHNATGAQTNVVVAPGKTVSSTISFDEAFALQSATLTLTITHPDSRQLVGYLEAPDGARIQLFSGPGAAPQFSNFIDTTFDDFATTPIQSSPAPFTGRFNPLQPLAPLIGKSSQGDWKLVITNNSTTSNATIVRWSLSLKQRVAGTGLGEAVADQEAVHFRIFTMDAADPLAQQVWTAVGPASISQSSVGRIGGLAVDPSDPTGNTVFVAGASGGIWKTTNFLTTSPNGPTYVPLTDFGPTFAINIGSLAVVARNNDSNQTMVFASTGEGDTSSAGVGFLRSLDGGKTWTLLDSTKNVYEPGDLPVGDPRIGTPLPINSPLRDHRFVGTTSFKVTIDPTPLPNGEYVIYGALSGGNGGVWISMDTGKTWGIKVGNNRVANRAGQANDISFSAFSAYDPINPSAPVGNVRRVFAAFRGEGVFQSSDFGISWQLMAGGLGNPLIRNYDETKNPATTPIPVTAPSATPNGAKGRIVLATPSLSGITTSTNRITDLGLQGWLYALVATPAGGMDGLYVTKDFGQNWTRIRLPQAPGSLGLQSGTPTNNESLSDYNVLGTQGNYDITLTVDPNNPNVVYLGGQPSPHTMIRVDITGLSDPHAIVAYNHSDPDGGTLQNASTGPVTPQPVTGAVTPGTYAGVAVPQPPFLGFPASLLTPVPYLNVLRDPTNPFAANATVLTLNMGQPAGRFNNEGTEAGWLPYVDFIGGADLHEVVMMLDPLTGRTRVIIGNDHGVFTGVDLGNGRLLGSIGSVTDVGLGGGDVPFVTGTRNGNIQLTQFYYGAAQPSPLAAQIAGAMFYGHAQDDGFPQSASNIIETGNISWAGPGFGDGTGVATDPTGSGTVYSYRWPCCGAAPDVTDFFLVNVPVASGGTGTYVSRTNGLVQQSNPGPVPDPQWPETGGVNFIVNPVNGNELLIGSLAGRLFRTRDQGLNWVQRGFVAGDPGANANNTFDGTVIPALAFGAKDPANPLPDTDQFFYAGTAGGSIYVTFDGGGTFKRFAPGTSGLSGSIQVISPNPRRGSYEAYAVTSTGVYWIADSKNGTTWTKLNDAAGMGALLGLRTDFSLHNFTGLAHDPASPDTQVERTEQSLKALVADWRDVIPDDLNNPGGPSHPALYVGGEAGVFRSLDKGKTWTIFPNVANDGAPVDGGFLPNADIRDLDLSAGNIDPTTGLPRQDLGYNLLVATTYGRGTFAIRLSPNDPFNPVHGPRVVDFTPDIPQNPLGPTNGLHTITITFATAVDPATFTISDLDLVGPGGSITALTLTDITVPAPGQPNLHNVWQITFPNQTAYGDYTLTVGPNVTDYSGRAMDQDNDFTNGEANDFFRHTFKVAGLKVDSVVPAIGDTPREQPVTPLPGLTDLIVTFNTAVDLASFNPNAPENDIFLVDPLGVRVLPISATDITPLDADGNNQHNVWRLSFAQQLRPGLYTLTVGQSINDLFGFPMDQNQNQVFGEPGVATGPGTGGDQFQATIRVDGLFVTDSEPDSDEPNLLPLPATSSITLTFNREIDPTTFTLDDLRLIGPGGVDLTATHLIQVVEPTTTNVEHNVWRIDFTSPTAPGVYLLTVGPDVLDTSGTQMDQNNNLVFGEPGDQFQTPLPGDQYTVRWVVDGLRVDQVLDSSGEVIDDERRTPGPINPLPRPNGTSFLDIVFNTEVDASSFTRDDITLTGPNGPVTLTGLNLAPGPNPLGNIWRLTFDPLTVHGTYSLTIGPDVLDRAGNKMNQNLNGLFGENPGDVFGTSFEVDGMRVLPPTSPDPTVPYAISGLSSITLTFNMTVDAASFVAADDLTLLGPGGVPVTLLALTDLTLGNTELNNVWRIDFAPIAGPGVYTLTVGPDVHDLLGNQMDQDNDADQLGGAFGEVPQDQFIVNYTVVGLQVVSIAPASPVVPSTMSFIDITFNTEVWSDFDVTDLTLTHENGVSIPLTSVTDITTGSPNLRNVWRVAFPTQTLPGVYTLMVGPFIRDRAGNFMNQDGDTGATDPTPYGEVPEDRFTGTVVLEGLRVVSTQANAGLNPGQPLPANPGLQSITLNFNHGVRPGTFTAADLTLTGPFGAAIPITDVVDLTLGNTNRHDVWEVRFATQTARGVYTLRGGPNLNDLADVDAAGNAIGGNLMNQDQDAVFGEPIQDQFLFNYVVEGLRVTGLTPAAPVPTATGVGSIFLNFNTEVGGDFSLAGDDVRITHPDGSVIALTALTDVTIGGTNRHDVWRVDFPLQATPGVYSVRVGPFIMDVLGNFMNQDRDAIYGEATEDRFNGTFVVEGLKVIDFTPKSSLTALPGLSEISVTFNMSVAAGTFTAGDVNLVGPGGAVTGITVTDVTPAGATPNTVFRINFPEQITPGIYTLTVGPNIADLALFDASGNPIPGHNMAQAFTTTIVIQGLWIMSATPNTMISAIGMSSIDVVFNTTVGTEVNGSPSFTPADVTLTGPEGAVPIAAVIPLAASGRNNVWRITFPVQHVIGTYALSVGPNVLDVGRNKMDQDRDFNLPTGGFGEPTQDVFRTSFNLVPQVLAAGPVVIDVGPLVSILTGRPRRVRLRVRGRVVTAWRVPLRIFNTSQATILGPFALAVDGLGRKARLISANSRTVFVARLGRAVQSQLLAIDQLGAFDGLDMTLFIQTKGKLPRLDLQLLAGGPF